MKTKQAAFLLALLLLLLAACAPQAAQVEALGSVDDLSARLEAAGAGVEAAGAHESILFSGAGQKIRVEGQEVQVFAYASDEARQAESSQISRDGNSVGMNMVEWTAPAHIWAKDHLLVLYVGNSAETVETLTGVLGPAITQP